MSNAVTATAGTLAGADEPRHRATRRRYTGPVDKEELDRFVGEIASLAAWLQSPQGRAEMADKQDRPHSVAASLIANILLFAADNGDCPLQIVESALLRYAATAGGDDIDRARGAVKAILNQADSATSSPAMSNTAGSKPLATEARKRTAIQGVIPGRLPYAGQGSSQA